MWQPIPSEIDFLKVLEARDNKEVQLMVGFDNTIMWRRDLTEYYELGL